MSEHAEHIVRVRIDGWYPDGTASDTIVSEHETATAAQRAADALAAEHADAKVAVTDRGAHIVRVPAQYLTIWQAAQAVGMSIQRFEDARHGSHGLRACERVLDGHTPLYHRARLEDWAATRPAETDFEAVSTLRKAAIAQQWLTRMETQVAQARKARDYLVELAAYEGVTKYKIAKELKIGESTVGRVVNTGAATPRD